MILERIRIDAKTLGLFGVFGEIRDPFDEEWLNRFSVPVQDAIAREKEHSRTVAVYVGAIDIKPECTFR